MWILAICCFHGNLGYIYDVYNLWLENPVFFCWLLNGGGFRNSLFGGCWVMWRCSMLRGLNRVRSWVVKWQSEFKLAFLGWILWSKVVWGGWRNVVAIVVWWCYFRLWGVVVGRYYMKMGWMVEGCGRRFEIRSRKQIHQTESIQIFIGQALHISHQP